MALVMRLLWYKYSGWWLFVVVGDVLVVYCTSRITTAHSSSRCCVVLIALSLVACRRLLLLINTPPIQEGFGSIQTFKLSKNKISYPLGPGMLTLGYMFQF